MAPVAVEWPGTAADFCLLLTIDDLPPVPFWLNPWTEVRDVGRMLRYLRANILRGPSGPRAVYGALQADLRELQRFALRIHDRDMLSPTVRGRPPTPTRRNEDAFLHLRTRARDDQ